MKRIILFLLILFSITPSSAIVHEINFLPDYIDYQGFSHKYTNENLMKYPYYSSSEDADNRYFTSLNDTITLPKGLEVETTLTKISPIMSFPKTQLVSRMINTNNASIAYLVFPYSLSRVKDFADNHNIRVGRWNFDTDITVYDSYYTVLSPDFYDFKIVNDEIRLYFLKSEADKLQGDIYFKMNSWTVDNTTTTGWTSSNVTRNNIRINSDYKLALSYNSTLYDGLVGCWDMDATTGTTILNCNNANGTLNQTNPAIWSGNTTLNYTSGQIGNAGLFDGLDDYYSVSGLKDFGTTSNFSMSVYVYPESGGVSEQHLLELGGTQFYRYGNSFRYRETDTILSANTFPTDKGYDIVLNRYGNGSRELYADTVLIANGNESSPANPSTILSIGDLYAHTGDYNFKGRLDEIKLYDHILSASEILELYNRSMVTSGNIIFNFDSGSGNEIKNVTANLTAPTGTNLSSFYKDNSSGTWTASTAQNVTEDTLFSVPAGTQFMDVKTELHGNGTATPELIEMIFGYSNIMFTLSGYVFNALELPLENSRVDFGGSFVFTDATGYYEFNNITEGTYSVLARQINYFNKSQSIELNNNSVQNFTLKERSQGVVYAPGINGLGTIIILIGIYYFNRRRI